MKRTFLHFVLMVASVATSFAQLPHVSWVRTLDSYHEWGTMPNSSQPKGIVQDRQNNICIAGIFLRALDLDAGTGVDSVYSENSGSYIIKYSPDGEYLWGKTIFNTAAYCIASDSAGNIYVGGEMYGYVDFDAVSGRDTFTSKGAADFFLLKINPEGDVEWVRAAGSYYGDAVKGIAADHAGNVYTTGYMHGNVDFDERNPGTVNYITIYRDAFIAKYNNNGYLEWSHRIQGDGGDNGYGICLSQTNDVVIVGGTEGCRFVNGGTLYAVTGRSDGFVAKYNRTTGDLLWAGLFGGDIDEWNNSVDIDADGNIYVGGAFSSNSFSFDDDNPLATVHKIGGGTYSTDGYLFKLDPEGAFIWANTIMSTEDEIVNSVKVDDSGSVYATGYFGDGVSSDFATLEFSSGFESGTTHTSLGGVDIFLLKADNDGILQWSRTFGTECINDIGVSLLVNSTFELYLAGTIGATTRFGEETIDSATGQDISLAHILNPISTYGTNTFFAKYWQYGRSQPPSSVEMISTDRGLTLYPNPASDYIILEANLKVRTLQIYDLQGKIVLNQDINSSSGVIDVRQLPSGSYFLKAISEDGNQVSRFVKK